MSRFAAPFRLILATAIACAATVAAAQPAPPETAAPESAKPPETAQAYVSGFCAPVALNDADPALFARLLSAWQAKAGDASADSMPQDASVPGQQFVFPAADAPRAFVERRRSDCALLYKGATAPPLLIEELKTVTLPLGDGDSPRPWRLITTRHAGPPGPKRYFLAVGGSPGFGLCATIFEDLRLRNNAPATLVKVVTCRVSGEETFDNG